MRISLVLLFVAAMVSPVLAQSTSSTSPTVPIITVIGTVLISAITAIFGIKKKSHTPVGQLALTVHELAVKRERVDKAIEAVLGAMGVPPAIADRIGDVVSYMAVNSPNFGVRDAMDMARELLTEQLTKQTPNEIAVTLKGEVRPEDVTSSSVRIHYANAVTKHPAVEQQLASQVQSCCTMV